MSVNTNPQLLFIIPPGDIHEHPTDLPTDPALIPDGPIEGWLVFAPQHDGPDCEFLGPVVPVVEREMGAGSRELSIKVGKYPFYFGKRPAHCCDTPTNRYCWYQSSTTLRFVRRRKTADERAKSPQQPEDEESTETTES